MKTLPALLKKLIQQQDVLNQTNPQFAKFLHISPSLWNQTRTGAKEINMSVLEGVVQALPEFIPDVIEYLKGNHRGQT